MRKLFFLILVLLVTGAAGAAPKLTSDSTGNLYQFWLAPTFSSSGLAPTMEVNTLFVSKSIDQGMTFGPSQALYNFTFEVTSCDLAFGPQSFCGIVFETSKESFLMLTGKEKGFGAPVKITDEATSFPAINIDNFGGIHILFVTEDKNIRLNRLNYLSITNIQSLESAPEEKTLYETPDEIINPCINSFPWGMAAGWQTKYLNRRETYVRVSLDQGKNFSKERTVLLKGDLLGLIFQRERWRLYAFDKVWAEKEFTSPAAAPVIPNIIYPKEGSVTNTSSPEIKYSILSPDPVISRIDLSPAKEFPAGKTWSFEILVSPGTTEVKYKLPIDLAEGAYFLRISAFDGLSPGSPSKTLAFKIDRSAPVINLTSPSAESSEEKMLLLEGKVNEAVLLYVNEKRITPEADGKFKLQLILLPGENILKILATDEAGNTASLSKKIIYSAIRPEIVISKPKETDWFKPDSTIFIEAQVYDLQNDIEDETEGEIIISGKTLEDKPIYDKKESKLSGFINLPKELADGKLLAKIRLKDSGGNTGEKELKINIDRLPPVLTLCASESAFTNSPTRITLPLQDAGAGVDPMGTLVKISGVSFKVIGSSESGIIIQTKTPLLDGTYEVEIVPRDLIGNTGATIAFLLIVDTTPPKPVILSTGEAHVRASAVIAACDNGPNPFSPRNDGQMDFTYDLSSAADLKIYIFDLSGTLIWKRDLNNVSAGPGNTSWNGSDNFGVRVHNGVYPYIFQVSAGGAIEIKRGRIIVLQ